MDHVHQFASSAHIDRDPNHQKPQTSAHFQLGDWLLSAFFLHDASWVPLPVAAALPLGDVGEYDGLVGEN